VGNLWATAVVHSGGWRCATRLFAYSWWLLALRGLLGIAFGIAALAWPGLTLIVLVALFGAYALIDGLVAILSVLRHQERGRWLVVLVEGLLGVAAGVVAFTVPGITAVALVLVIGAWAVLTGIMEIAAAIRLRREMENEWLLGLAGILSLVFGAAVIVFPGAGAIALVTLIGAYSIVFGVLMLLLGLQLRNARPMVGFRGYF
jgi:uncharacterized membrane protein HdeD (DUF308 family)